MTQQGVLESHQQRLALFAQSRQVTADATKDGDTMLGAKTARDLLLHFHHAQIPLGLIVVERHGKIRQEGQDLPCACREPIKQIAGRMLFRAGFRRRPIGRDRR